jgi:tetratricopeptide (TPR) repeat protein
MKESIKKWLKVFSIITAILFVSLQIKPKLAPFFINKGIENFKKNNFNKSSFYLKIASFFNPREPLIHFKLAQIYRNKRLFYQTIQEYKKALNLNNKFSEASLGLANTYIELGQYDKAIIELNKGLKFNSTNQKIKQSIEIAKYDYTQYLINKATNAYTKKKRDAARKFLKIASELKPDYLFNPFMFENTLTKKESTNKAIAKLEKIVKMDPDYRIAYRLLGDSWLKNLAFKKAIDAYEKYLTIAPNDAAIHNNLAVCYNRLGLLDKSIEQYRIALSLYPDNINIIYGLAYSYLQSEMYQEALNLYNYLIKLQADLPYIYIDLAQIYKKTKKIDMAKNKLKEAIKITSENLKKNPTDQISRITLNEAKALLKTLNNELNTNLQKFNIKLH